MSAACCLPVLGVCWAVAPLLAPSTEFRAREPRIAAPAPTRDPSPPRRLDASAFDVKLWVEPTVVTPPVIPTASPAPPIRLELIAIIAEDGQFSAALYDPRADRLHLVTTGQRIDGLEIVDISARGVRLRDGTRVQQLRLLPEPHPPIERVSLVTGLGGQP